MATINGTAGNDTLLGTSSSDTISGLGGNDRLQANEGNDTVLGGAGNDTVRGNAGTDWVEGGTGNDNVGGGEGVDSFVFREAGSANADVFNDFLSGRDNLQLDAAFFTALGAAGQFSSTDARFSSSGTAQDGDDRIIYNTTTRQLWYDADGNGSGTALLIGTLNTGATIVATDIHVFGGGGGGSSGQNINGTSGNDSLVGGPGNDTINGLAGNDTLVGLAGHDVLDGGTGADSMDGGLGNDTFYFDHFGDVLADAGGIDTLVVENGGSLPDGIENLVVRNAFQETDAVGNSLNNVIRVESAEPGSAVYVDGRAGNDTVDGAGGFIVAQFNGSFGNDSVQGGARGGWLDFNGSGGSVVVQIATGTAISSAGNVTFTGIANVVGSDLADRITAAAAGSRINGFGGDDTLIGGAGNDSFFGEGTQFGAPVETFGTGNDSIFGGAGNDTLFGNDGNDTLDGGLGNDRLGSGPVEVSQGNDTFMFTVAPGLANADLVTDFDSGADRIVLDGNAHVNTGPSGTFTVSDARFWFSGTGLAHDADDRVIYDTSSGRLWYDSDGTGAAGPELIATLEATPALRATDITIINGSGTGGGGGGTPGPVVNGTSGHDSLAGTPNNDTINGLAGNDTVLGSAGNDAIDGGTGLDSIEYKNAASGMVVDFAAGTITGGAAGGAGSMIFTGIERIVAGGFNDHMTGSAAGQTLTGQSGSDTIAGGRGADILWGGGGNDFFVFRETESADADRISDWVSGADKVQLDDAAFTNIGALGNFAAGDGRFWSAPGATVGHDANDRVIYNQTTGSLYYDADGSGGGGSQLIATFSGNPAVAATDIVVI